LLESVQFFDGVEVLVIGSVLFTKPSSLQIRLSRFFGCVFGLLQLIANLTLTNKTQVVKILAFKI